MEVAVEIGWVNSPDGEAFLRRDDVIAFLKGMGDEYLGHIPTHAEAGEFFEALQDRWAAHTLHQAADALAELGIPG